MGCIAGAEPIATEFSSNDHEYMHMVINLATANCFNMESNIKTVPCIG